MNAVGQVRAAAGLVRHRTLEALHLRGLGGRALYVSEFPKSGGTWVKELTRDLLSALASDQALAGVGAQLKPAPVIHQHWPYRPSLSPSLYVVRDGRDVVVSLYFHMIRHLQTGTLFSRRARAYCDAVFQPGADPMDTHANLPAFIRSLSTHPFAIIVRPRRDRCFSPWPAHIEDWRHRPEVLELRYENLLSDTPAEISRIACWLGHALPDTTSVAIAERHSFERQTGRKPGTENPIAFRRKGVAGDWKNHFTREAAEAFAALAGPTLIQLGYEPDDTWVTRV